jgi:excisionase family DNA binding protein
MSDAPASTPLRYLTLEAAAALCGTPAESIRGWVARGRLRGFRPGRGLLVREDELIALVESCEVSALRQKRAREEQAVFRAVTTREP